MQMPTVPLDSRLSNLDPVKICTLFVVLVTLSGCHQFETPSTDDLQALLRSVESSPKSVTLEIFQLRFSGDDQALVIDLWQQVDEQRLTTASRQELIRNGFRAGVVGGTLPDSLAEALNLQSEMPASSPSRLLTGQSVRPNVTRRVLQLANEEHAAIHASELRQQIDLLVGNESGLHGKTFIQAEAAYVLRTERSAGQQIVMQLTPEIHHGELRNRYTAGDQGMFLMTPSREHEVYGDLRIRAELAPGELLVVGCLPSSSGSLGHVFHTDRQQGRLEHKLVLVRLLQVPPSEILAAE